jgi:hypothetical protein
MIPRKSSKNNPEIKESWEGLSGISYQLPFKNICEMVSLIPDVKAED